MSPLVRNLMLGVALAATVLGAVRAMAALPEHLHRVGIGAPETFESVLVDVLEAR